MKIEHRHVIRVMDALHELGWAGRIEQADAKTDSAWVLLIDLSTTPLAPLAEKLWLAHPSEADVIWQKTHLNQLTVATVNWFKWVFCQITSASLGCASQSFSAKGAKGVVDKSISKTQALSVLASACSMRPAHPNSCKASITRITWRCSIFN